ncbi:fumarylacetoacetate hydrolase [Rhizorhabdus dicambivorans]|uniref:Fumarylacetoacetate hydrolase n=2 Tax=Rhizorhabdus dicambivorans TaxID=1850238 RepID=A0A2A4G356_9SPHN|nr:fumarylacetoacetate hydrolase [Rhizorhabdus dicambivorans]PCE44448.1 fumarylacetoacetate hydrolase [Rhizorhabdus dicambivorans]
MGRDPDREPPFFFTKFPDSVVPSGSTIAYPPGTANYHYEMELVIAMGAHRFKANTDNVLDAVYGYACGLDMTRRDLQLQAREQGRPWDLGKSFEESAVMGSIRPASAVPSLGTARISLEVNGTIRQTSSIGDMIWSTAEIISILSQYYPLGPGDLIFTGTPAGVGAVVPGDYLLGKIDSLPSVETKIGNQVG